MRERLKDTRRSVTHRVKIGAGEDAIKLFITVGLYEDGRPGEIFIQVLQNGVTLDKLHEKLSFQEFAPNGMTDNKDIRFARSAIDYVVRWMMTEFGEEKQVGK